GKLKPSKYTSFNTRSDKLNIPNAAGFVPYRKSRCIIPATAIVEGEGAKNKRTYHHIAAQNHAFAMGGLYRQWINKETGERVHACSIITLAPHPAWQGIHSKSTPMFLPVDDKDIIEKWLDPEFSAVDEFTRLLYPEFRDSLLITPIDKPSSRRAIAESFCI
ncbi:MAG: SOS response-associated peptidase, partial [Pseudomonadales bacterium]|nr:SOS response-associated peptidase [Pseudomonadales bacterium]